MKSTIVDGPVLDHRATKAEHVQVGMMYRDRLGDTVMLDVNDSLVCLARDPSNTDRSSLPFSYGNNNDLLIHLPWSPVARGTVVTFTQE